MNYGKINWLWGSDRNPAQREREQRKLSREEKARKDFAKKIRQQL
jgi:hypothetical protein